MIMMMMMMMMMTIIIIIIIIIIIDFLLQANDANKKSGLLLSNWLVWIWMGQMMGSDWKGGDVLLRVKFSSFSYWFLTQQVDKKTYPEQSALQV